VLVEEHAEQQRERIAAQQFVGGGGLGEGQLRHPGSVPQAQLTPLAIRRLADLRAPGTDCSARPDSEP
jgi:hypothetical protein